MLPPTYQSPFEATVVRQLRARGALVVAKTNMDEFGMGSHSTYSAHGPVRNPRNPHLSAGGSSGGSAAAVAAGDADLALGTDTGGSVRLPAAYAGVVGYKPSWGMLSRFGVVPYANSLDTVGLMARDVAHIRDVMFGEAGLEAQHDPRDPTSLSPSARQRCRNMMRIGGEQAEGGVRRFRKKRLTIGIPIEYNIAELDPLIRSAWVDAATRLELRGDAKVVPVSLPTTRHSLPAYYVLAPAEASSNLAKYDSVRYGALPPIPPASSPLSSFSPPVAAESVTQPSNRRYSHEKEEEEEAFYAVTRGAHLGAEVRRRILLGTYTLSSAAMDNFFIQAQRVRRLVQTDFDRVFARRNPLLCDDGDDGVDATGAEGGYDNSQRRRTQFDLSDLPEGLGGGIEDKLGPAQVDFLLCPTASGFAPPLDEVERMSGVETYVNDVFTVPASLAGVPAVSVPWRILGGEGEEGKGDKSQTHVTGLQLIGQYWDDERLLEVAEQLFSYAVSPTPTHP